MKEVDKTEFFWENPQMLGFTNPSRATLMVVKELLDNSLDACEDIETLPEIELYLKTTENGDIKIISKDNGIGIPNPKTPKVFGELLFGSKFGTFKQSRGQQGIGVSAAFMWSQKSVGKPVKVITQYYEDYIKHDFKLTTKGKGNIKVLSHEVHEVPDKSTHGTYVEMEFKGSWRCKNHLKNYLEGTALANPEANIYIELDDEAMNYVRTIGELPQKPKEIKPHPHSVDIGMLETLITTTRTVKLKNFLWEKFCVFGDKPMRELDEKLSFSLDRHPKYLKKEHLRELVEAIKTVQFRNPPSNCLAPIGEEKIISALERYNPEHCSSVTRYIDVHDGHPFLIEVGVAYGGEIGTFNLFRIANKVPLVYDEGNCAISEGIRQVDFRNYYINNSHNGYPDARMVLLVHICSTLIPYSTQAKTFIANKDVIINEARLAVQQVMRRTYQYINSKISKREHEKEINTKFDISCRLFNVISDIVEKKDDEVPYFSIAKMSKSLFYDDESGTLYNTFNNELKISGTIVEPHGHVKTNKLPKDISVLNKSSIDNKLNEVV